MGSGTQRAHRIRASGGMFYDNFLLQNAYQDRINRLSNGQYNRSLTLCPTGAVLFRQRTDRSMNSVSSGRWTRYRHADLRAADQSGCFVAIQDLQSQFQAAQSAGDGRPERVLAGQQRGEFGGLLAPGFKTPRVVHMSAGIQHQMGERGMFSADYVRELGTQFPLGIDTNHVGDAGYLTDGSN
jgi:hypothetical protein